MNPKTCLITGATSGIGKAAARELAKKNYGLILIGRDEKKTARVCEEIKRKEPKGAVSYDVCDLSLLRDVRDLADRIKKGHPRIDVLINNAGARFLRHQLTEEGIEMTLATNHLGPFVLTLSLIDTLNRSEQGRIINVSSSAHYTGACAIENILSAKDYNGRKQYSNSKLANIIFTYALAKRLKDGKLTVNAVDPGSVATNFARNNGLEYWLHHRIYHLMKRELLTPAQGAETIIHLASSSDVEGTTGKYFRDKKATRSSDISYAKEIQEKLWASSVGLSGMDL